MHERYARLLQLKKKVTKTECASCPLYGRSLYLIWGRDGHMFHAYDFVLEKAICGHGLKKKKKKKLGGRSTRPYKQQSLPSMKISIFHDLTLKTHPQSPSSYPILSSTPYNAFVILFSNYSISNSHVVNGLFPPSLP